MARTRWDEMLAQRLAEPGATEEFCEIHEQIAIGEEIVRARQARGWTQRDLAKAAGVAARDVDIVELGDLDGKLGVVEKVARVLNLQLQAKSLRLVPAE